MVSDSFDTPSSPDSHASDPQDAAEALDSDTLGRPDGTAVDPDFPADELLGADDFGITSAEEQIGEPLDERVDRESPDPLVEELSAAESAASDAAATTSVDAMLDELELDFDDETLVAIDGVLPVLASDGVRESGDQVGRLVEPGVDEDVLGLDDERDSVARAYPEGDLSAEEAAIHLTDEPPMSFGGGYS
jgi:hypothetical protein